MKALPLAAVLVAGAFLAACTQNVEEPPVNETHSLPSVWTPETGRTANLKLLPGATLYNLERLGPVVNPFGRARLIINTLVPFDVSGWAVDAEAGQAASGVDIVIDQKPFTALYSLDRPDVAEHFHTPAYGRSGFELTIPATQLDAGQHTLMIRIIDHQARGYFQSPSLLFDLR